MTGCFLTVVFCTALLLFGMAYRDNSSGRVTILHINDFYEIESNDDGRGAARIKTIFDQVKADDSEAIMLLSGDFLSPSLMSSLFAGKGMIAALNAVGLSYVTIGNHEFDIGVDALNERIAESKFPWVISNLYVDGSSWPGTARYIIKEINGVKVGLFGLVTEDTKTLANLPDNITFADVYGTTNEIIALFQRENVEIIVAITHLEMDVDRALADRFPEIDLIMGGHDHIVITESFGETTIVKSGSNGEVIGKVVIDKVGSPKITSVTHIETSSDIAEDPGVVTVVEGYSSQLAPYMDVKIGESDVELDATRSNNRGAETNIGNFIADAMREKMTADVALINGGGVRSDTIYGPGVITRRDIYSILPFGNYLCKIRVTGKTLIEALEHGVSKLDSAGGAFPQVSGLSFTVNRTNDTGNRIGAASVNGKELEPDSLYTVATIDYLFDGGDGYDMFGDTQIVVAPEFGPLLAESVVEKIVEKQNISPKVEGRIGFE